MLEGCPDRIAPRRRPSRTLLLLLALPAALAGCSSPSSPDGAADTVARLCREVPARLEAIAPPEDLAGLRRYGREAAPVLVAALRELGAIRTSGPRTIVDEIEDAAADALRDLDGLAAGQDPGASVESLGLQATRVRSSAPALGAGACAGTDNVFLDPLREPVYERELPLADTAIEVEQLDEPLHVAAEHRRLVEAMRAGDGRAARRARRGVIARISAARAARARWTGRSSRARAAGRSAPPPTARSTAR